MIGYLAHPIDLYETVDISIGKITLDLVESGFVVYDPFLAFAVPKTATPTPAISRVNEEAMRQADVFVIVEPEARTIGTVLELAYAVQSGKPTVVVTAALGRSWSLAGLDFPAGHLTGEWEPGHAGWLREMHEAAPVSPPDVLLKYSFNDQAGPDPVGTGFWPRRSYSGDAGFDLYVTEDTEIPVGQFADIPCGLNIELPPGTWGMILGRSSTLRKHNLLVAPGVIDQGYRGPLYSGVYNMNGTQFSAKRGMRLAQFIPFPLTAERMVPHWVPNLTDSDRGTRGFGSTGV